MKDTGRARSVSCCQSLAWRSDATRWPADVVAGGNGMWVRNAALLPPAVQTMNRWQIQTGTISVYAVTVKLMRIVLVLKWREEQKSCRNLSRSTVRWRMGFKSAPSLDSQGWCLKRKTSENQWGHRNQWYPQKHNHFETFCWQMWNDIWRRLQIQHCTSCTYMTGLSKRRMTTFVFFTFFFHHIDSNVGRQTDKIHRMTGVLLETVKRREKSRTKSQTQSCNIEITGKFMLNSVELKILHSTKPQCA